MAAARINQREKCALITGNKDIGGLRGRRLDGRGRKSRKTRPAVAWGGPYGYDFARSRGSSGECQVNSVIAPPSGFAFTESSQIVFESLGAGEYNPAGELGAMCRGVDSSGRFAVTLATSEPSCAVECVYIGGHQNFGHFVFQTLLRLSMLGRVSAVEGLPIAIHDDLPSRFLEFLDVLGFTVDKRITIPAKHPTRFKSVWLISSPMMRSSKGIAQVHSEAIWRLRQNGSRSMRYFVKPRPRLFIERGNTRWRRLINEADTRIVLERHNVHPTDFSKLSAEDQIGLASNAELIVSTSGAGGAITAFAPPDCDIVELIPTA